MKLDPGFPGHWKTEMLIDRLGAEAVLAVLRLWGGAQINREFAGLSLTPKSLAMKTKWRGDPQELFDVLTDPDAPWLDREEDGTFTIHGFAEHQHQAVRLWTLNKNGRAGKVSPTPPSKDETSSSSFSSSYPICEANGNHMVPEGSESAHGSLLSRLGAIRAGWEKPLTKSEAQAEADNRETIASMTDDDWQTITGYMKARIPEGMEAWQPTIRRKFIETIGDVFTKATEWGAKRHRSAGKASVVAIPERQPIPREELAEVFGKRVNS